MNVLPLPPPSSNCCCCSTGRRYSPYSILGELLSTPFGSLLASSACVLAQLARGSPPFVSLLSVVATFVVGREGGLELKVEASQSFISPRQASARSSLYPQRRPHSHQPRRGGLWHCSQRCRLLCDCSLERARPHLAVPYALHLTKTTQTSPDSYSCCAGKNDAHPRRHQGPSHSRYR